MHIDDDINQKVSRFLEQMPQNMAHVLGIEFISFKKDEVEATMPVDENTIQPFGILHGGASVALAETLASVGAWLNIDEQLQEAVGVEINANHLRSMPKGTSVNGVARPVRRGRKIQVWEIEIRSPEGKLVCVSRCTLAVVEKPSP